MRKAHTVPATVKAANLARWFPPWTMSREQWTTILRSSISGVAVDTILFSRIGVPLLHRYRVFSHAGTHVAFCGTYMAHVRAFIEESDIACLRSRNRRRARVIASQMFQTTPQEARSQELDNSSQPGTSRRPGSQVRKSVSAAAVAAESLTPVVVRSLCSGPRATRALMDLALPQFATPELQSKQPRSQWIVTLESPASPAPLRTPSLCLSLNTLSSDGSVGQGDVSAHPICISDVSSHSGDPDQILSDDDLPPEVHVDDLLPEVHVDLVSPVSPPVSARMSQCSPPEAPLVQSADSSVANSPNRVRSDSTPDILDTGPVFEVSPDTTGFLMRPSGAAVQAPLGSSPIQPGLESDCAPVLGEPVAFTLSEPIPGSDAPPMTFPVYPLPFWAGIVPGVTICSDGFGIGSFYATG